MKTIKNILVIITIACSLLLIGCKERDNFKYEINEEGTGYILNTIDSIDKNKKEKIVIPSEYKGLPVVEIADYAFSNYIALTSIEIPNSITRIGFGAFENCFSLTSITIPFVGERNYSENSHLAYIFGGRDYTDNANLIPESLKTVVVNGECSIDENAFYNCNYIEMIVLNRGVTYVKKSAIYDCEKLETLVISKSVYVIESFAIYANYNLTIYCEAESQAFLWSNNWCDVENVYFGAVKYDDKK